MLAVNSLSARRLTNRDRLLGEIARAAREHGAAALHLFASMGRGTADELSDVDIWLTFPGELINDAVRIRWRLYGAVGEILLAHEMAPNRPTGGVYTLVLYATPAGPQQDDWYLAP
jgi:predicted nucleotidyltransferase